MKILSIVGARPQLVKAAAVSRKIRRAHEEFLLHTGQHYDYEMSQLFFRELELPEPVNHLGVGSGSHGAQTGAMLAGLDDVYTAIAPDIVITHGDTNSTLAGALAAAKLGIAVAHVEAGLRSWNRVMAEEINRVVVDHIADLLFCPSEHTAENLRREGITAGVHVVGDLMRDSLRWTLRGIDRSAILARHELRPGEFFFATIHRAENTDDPQRLQGLLAGLERINALHPVILAAHPRTRPHIDVLHPAVRVIEPVGHPEAMALTEAAAAVLTDSGGLQKEAYWLQTPCVTLRGETEWVETVAAGWNQLVDAEPAAIELAAKEALGSPPPHPQLYGDGNTAARIVDVLLQGQSRD